MHFIKKLPCNDASSGHSDRRLARFGLAAYVEFLSEQEKAVVKTPADSKAPTACIIQARALLLRSKGGTSKDRIKTSPCKDLPLHLSERRTRRTRSQAVPPGSAAVKMQANTRGKTKTQEEEVKLWLLLHQQLTKKKNLYSSSSWTFCKLQILIICSLIISRFFLKASSVFS